MEQCSSSQRWIKYVGNIQQVFNRMTFIRSNFRQGILSYSTWTPCIIQRWLTGFSRSYFRWDKLYLCAFYVAVWWDSDSQGGCFCWWAAGSVSPSEQTAAVITFPHFTSSVINGLCQSSWIIGRTSPSVKRLISTRLCGWLKAMINNGMAFTQDLFCCSMLHPADLVYLHVVNVDVFSTTSYKNINSLPEKIWIP